MTEQYLDPKSRAGLGLDKLWKKIENEWLWRLTDDFKHNRERYGISLPKAIQSQGGNTAVKIKPSFNNSRLKPWDRDVNARRVVNRSEYTFHYNRISLLNFDAEGVLHNQITQDTQRKRTLSIQDGWEMIDRMKQNILTRLALTEEYLIMEVTDVNERFKRVTIRFNTEFVPEHHYILISGDTQTFEYKQERVIHHGTHLFSTLKKYPELEVMEEIKDTPFAYPISRRNLNDRTYNFQDRNYLGNVPGDFHTLLNYKGNSNYYLVDNFSKVMEFLRGYKESGATFEDNFKHIFARRLDMYLKKFLYSKGLDVIKTDQQYISVGNYFNNGLSGVYSITLGPYLGDSVPARYRDSYRQRPILKRGINTLLTITPLDLLKYPGTFNGKKSLTHFHFWHQSGNEVFNIWAEHIGRQNWIEQIRNHSTEATALKFKVWTGNGGAPDGWYFNGDYNDANLNRGKEFWEVYPVPFPGVDNLWVAAYYSGSVNGEGQVPDTSKSGDEVRRVSLNNQFDDVLYKAIPFTFGGNLTTPPRLKNGLAGWMLPFKLFYAINDFSPDGARRPSTVLPPFYYWLRRRKGE